ncbi:biotin synthase auxiliary protein BsaP [Micromonospora zhanjiangensis]|uniref:Biotin synthase auxiliary protein n=1 Tax=Micromonospora zhanjiangensis TaxID=1522057 RepID=A0ABV8KH84_9ACTN
MSAPLPRTAGPAGTDGPPWCDRCGEPAAAGPHDACGAARQLEPPRFCPDCRRRMKVQVVPTGWTAVCVQHGELRS